MTTYFVLSTSSGSPISLGQLVGNGSPRIFSGDALYVYRLDSALWTTRDFGGNWINISPSSAISNVCQTSGSSTKNITYATGYSPTLIPAYYQEYPELTVWSSGSPIPSGLLSDAVSSTIGDLPILMGNLAAANAARIWRTGFEPPYSAIKSDSGFPSTAQVTDIDIAE